MTLPLNPTSWMTPTTSIALLMLLYLSDTQPSNPPLDFPTKVLAIDVTVTSSPSYSPDPSKPDNTLPRVHQEATRKKLVGKQRLKRVIWGRALINELGHNDPLNNVHLYAQANAKLASQYKKGSRNIKPQ